MLFRSIWAFYNVLNKSYPAPVLPLFNFLCQPESHLYIAAHNDALAKAHWIEAESPILPIPRDRWFFVAVSLEDGAAGKGRLQIMVDDRIVARPFQQIGGGLEDVQDIAGVLLEGVMDELAVWRRALSEAELREVFSLTKWPSKGDGSTVKPIKNNPFVVLGQDGQPKQKCATLAEAVAGADDGATIEIRGNGPFETDPVQIRDRALVIRAGAGCRPVIKLSTKGHSDDLNLLVTYSPLALEGLEFHRVGSGPAGRALVAAVAAPLYVANCQFLVKDNNAVFILAVRSPTLEVRNCAFIGSRGAVELSCGKEGILTVDNCVLTSAAGVAFDYTPGVDKVRVRVTRNTFACFHAVALPIFAVPDFVTSAAKRYDLEAADNVFDVAHSIFIPTQSADIWRDKPIAPAAFKKLVADLLDWRERSNLYPARTLFMVTQKPGGPYETLLGPGHLKEWQQFGGAEAGSLRGKACLDGADMHAKAFTVPELLLPNHFKLLPKSSGHRAGKDGKDLGADIELVGPGPAYERWKATPAYQQWLKDTGQVKVESAGAEAKPFVVLGSKEISERRLSTLAEAVAASKSGDTIEIRGNGPFETDPIDIRDRALVIRAGAGCRPVLKLSAQGNRNDLNMLLTNAALVLEGLEFHRIGSSPAMSSLIASDAAPLFVANCQFMVKHNNAVSLWGHWSPTLEVRNSAFFGSRCAVESPCPKEGTLSVDNCLLTSITGVFFHHSLQVDKIRIRLTRNTFAGYTAVGLPIFTVPDFTASEAKPKARRYGLEIEESIFDVADSIFHAYQYAEAWRDKPVAPVEFKNIVADLVDWRERRNLYPVKTNFMVTHKPGGPFERLLGPEHLKEWQQFAGSEAGSLCGKVRFAGGDLFAKADTNPELLLPKHFSLLPDSAGHRAGKDGKDLGADVDLVGPGPAYERWKTTPAYQVWLKNTGQEKK